MWLALSLSKLYDGRQIYKLSNTAVCRHNFTLGYGRWYRRNSLRVYGSMWAHTDTHTRTHTHTYTHIYTHIHTQTNTQIRSQTHTHTHTHTHTQTHTHTHTRTHTHWQKRHPTRQTHLRRRGGWWVGHTKVHGKRLRGGGLSELKIVISAS
jgi:hypothetical protein